ncbi:MAG TPA: serine hydrolase domain-containing protein [Thermomicrobiales bacterium]
MRQTLMPIVVLLTLMAATLAGGVRRAVPAASADAGIAPAALDAELQAVLDRQVAAAPGVPGLLVYVNAPALGIEWSGAAGVADRATGEPLTPDRTFRIASNTKTYTAAAVLRLAEEGRLALDAPIGTVLPADILDLLKGDGYDPDAIQIRHLLWHTSGLYDYAEDPGFQEAVISQAVTHWTRLDQVRFAMEHGDPVGQPGQAFHYSDTGYVLAGEIVERVSGQPLAAAFRDLLGFDRLGLGSTYLEGQEPTPSGAAAREHQYYGDVDTTGFDPSFDLYGGGGLVASAADLGRFYRALLRGDIFREPATLETMLTIPPSNAGEGAMGIFGSDVDGVRCWGHSGFWGTTALHCPAIDLTIAFSVNDALRRDDVGNQSLLPELFALLRSAGATAPEAADHEATPAPPPAGLIVPDPSECTVEPRPLSFFAQLAATPPPPAEEAADRFARPGEEARPWTMPAGEPADAATVTGITATLREALACLNAGDQARFMALFSDDILRFFFALNPIAPEALAALLAATPVPQAPGQQLGTLGVHDARVLPDGRVAALADDYDPTEPPFGLATDYAEFVKVGDRWLIDSLIENVAVVGEGEPGAASPAASASALAGLGLPELRVRITDAAFEVASAEVPAGRILLTVENASSQDGISADLVRLPDGLTVDAAIAAMATPTATGAFPDWVYAATWTGGPILNAGQTVRVVVDLTAGDWYVFGVGGQAPQPVRVTAGSGTTPAEPAAAVDVQMQDFAFVGLPERIAPGPQIWRIGNAGPQPHLLSIDRVPDGTTTGQVLASMAALFGGTTPPADALTEADFVGVGGLEAESAGQTAWLEVDFAPGTYFVACYIPDQTSGQGHVMLGMAAVLTVG